MSDEQAPTGPGPDADRLPTVSVAEAAQRLGVTPDAIRARINRGTLAGEKHGGVWHVYWPDEGDEAPTGRQPDTTAQRPDTGDPLIEQLRGEVEYLRGELSAQSRELAVERERSAAERERADVLMREALGRIAALAPGNMSHRAESEATTDAGETREHAPGRTQEGPRDEQGGDGDPEPVASWWRRWWRSLQGGS